MPNDPIPAPVQDPAAGFQRLLEQHKNDGVAVASKLFDENYTYRQKIRELTEKQPKDGDVVLSADDAKEWNAFKALNVKTADAKKALDSIATLEQQNKELAAMETLRELADVGIDGSKLKLSVLKDQLTAKYPDAKITFTTQKDKDGKEVKVASIQKTDKDAVQPFAEFAKAELADYIPSLKVSPEATQVIPPGNTGDPQPQSGAGSVYDRIRTEVREQGSQNKVRDIDAAFGRPSAAAA